MITRLALIFLGLAGIPTVVLGQETQNLSVFEDAYPFWSPDGTHIVFQSTRIGGINQIFVMSADGSSVRQLTFTKEHNRTPVWSPDGTKIAFQSERDGNREIYVMDADGNNQTRLTFEPEEDSHPKWSADGSEIIFDSHRDAPDTQMAELYIMHADGSSVQRLTDYADYDSYSSLAPDSETILWRRIIPEGGNSESGRNSEVFIVKRDGGRLENLTDHPAFDGYPSWSPDGQWIVFASNRDGHQPNEFNLYAMRQDRSGLTKLTETIPGVLQARPMVSPDGTNIVFNRDFPDGTIEIHVMPFVPE